MNMSSYLDENYDGIWNITEQVDTAYCNTTVKYTDYTVYGKPMFIVFPPINVLLNVVVLCLIYKNVKVHDQYDQWFVVGFTVSDLMWNLTLTCTSLYQPLTTLLPRWACKPYFGVKFYFTITLVLFLLLLNLNRFVKLFLPLQFHSFISRRTTCLKIAFVLLVPFVFILYLTITLNYQFADEFPCRVWPNSILNLFMLIVFYASPLAISFLISISIFVLAQRKSAVDNENRRKFGGKFFKRIIFVFSYTIWISASQLPYRISYIHYYVLCKQYLSSDSVEELSRRIAGGQIGETECRYCMDPRPLVTLLCLMPLCAVLNPVITIVTQKHYRKGLKEFGHGMTTSLSNLTRSSGHHDSVGTHETHEQNAF